MTGDSTTAGSGNSASGETDGGTADSRADDEGAEGMTRRGFVKTAAGTAAAGTAAAVGTDEASAQAQTYRFGGEVAAWHGRAPSQIEGQENPTVELQAGQQYEFWFENIDSAPHNMTIQDTQGNTIVQSELVQGEGSTASVTFTATSNMAQYICTIHPTTMVGDVNVSGQVEGGGGGGLPMRTLVFAAGVVLAFLSPLLFAFFLFSRGSDGPGETTGT